MIGSSENQVLLGKVVPHITAWYDENRVSLPWRLSPTPYHVWISEIMLQQTRIEAALGYYGRFLAELPDIPSLAAVDEDKLMKLWQGLGYYSRARNLKKAAIQVMEQYGGTLPDSAEALRKLPGIGEYTAGAIASIAYHKGEPAVDGNVLRVISRMIASYEDIMLPATKKAVTVLLKAVYPEGREAALLTEGLMELGERVCIPNGEPRCEACPVRHLCRAKKEGIAGEIPVRNARVEKRREDKTVLLLKKDGKYAIVRRPDKGLLAGMWEFPSIDGSCAEGDVESYLVEHSICVKPENIKSCGEGRHIFTHIVWEMKGFLCEVENEGGPFLWKSGAEILDSYAIPSAYRIFLKKLK